MSKDNSQELNELGRAVARGIAETNAQKERNMQKEARRQESMLKNAAEKALGQNYS